LEAEQVQVTLSEMELLKKEMLRSHK